MRQCSWLLKLTLEPSSKNFTLCRPSSALQDTRATPKSPKPWMRLKSSDRETPGRQLGEAGVGHWPVLGNHGHWQQAGSDNSGNNWCSAKKKKSVLSFWKVLFPYPERFLKINTFSWVLICCCCWVVFFLSEKNLASLALISPSLNFKKHIITVK